MAEKGLRKWVITITVITASLLELIDTTIVNVALSQIMGNLGATLSDVSWLVTGYAVANVIVLPMSGWLSARFGRKNYFLTSIIIFTIASYLCGNSDTLIEIIVFRILQGLAGGGLISTAQAILFETWPREEAGMAMALFGVGAVFGPTVGPAIGGYLTDNYSWPWIFYVNIPVGIIAALSVIYFIKETSKTAANAKVDWWGIILLAISIGCLQVVLEKGETEDWFETTYISILTLISVLSGLAFLWRETSIDYPVVNFNIMRYRSFSIGMFTSFILGFGLYSSLFVFPILCQNIIGFTALQTGIILIPGGIATIMMMPVTGTLLKKGIPGQYIATGGFILFYVFTSMLSHTTSVSGIDDFFWPMIIRGLGMAILFVPLTTLGIQDLKGAEIGQGTGLNNMMRQLGGSFGIAIANTILSHRISFHRNILVEYVNPYSEAFQQRFSTLLAGFKAKGFSIAQAQDMAYKALDGIIMKQASLLAYNDIFWMVGLFMLCCIPMIYMQKFNKGGAVAADVH